ncbi:MAG: DUF3783 domain-containing protein [Oscillospiraceae bacterium]|nr:DUF3783 domain-containing protein [Oscillospiraceae bacterium]
MRPKVLLYCLGIDSEKGRLLRGVLCEQKLLTLDVDEKQLGEKVGRLAATNAAAEGARAPESIPREEFMLLCGLGGRQLDRLLAAMRRAGVSVPYKAVLTDTNREWTLCKLIEAVVHEHEMMKKQ